MAGEVAFQRSGHPGIFLPPLPASSASTAGAASDAIISSTTQTTRLVANVFFKDSSFLCNGSCLSQHSSLLVECPVRFVITASPSPGSSSLRQRARRAPDEPGTTPLRVTLRGSREIVSSLLLLAPA